jgi:hypothetical protein
MRFNNPIPRTGKPFSGGMTFESSSQRSRRDADATDRQWLKNNDTRRQNAFLQRSVYELQRAMSRQRVFKPQTTTSTLQIFRIKDVHFDYLTCRTWDFSSEGGGDIKVALPFRLRRNITGGMGSYYGQVIKEDVTHTYTYADDLDLDGINNVIRTDSYSSTTEDQKVTPAWYLNEVVIGTPIANAFCIDDDGTTKLSIPWILTCESRQWAAI